MRLTWIFLLAACATGGQSVHDQINQLMRDYSGNAPGASVLVVRNGEIAFQRGLGLANLEEKVAASPETNYRLASVTKQFTAAAILLLSDRGLIRLDDPIRRFLPSLPPYADGITIRHLLTHTSGLIDYEGAIPEGTTRQLLDADVLRLMEQQDHTHFVPGTKYQYSNSGYALLALIVERVSGKSFAEFLHDEIFQPLGMSATVAHQEGIDTVSQRAYGYTRRDGRWERTDQSLTSAVLGDGGIYSSIADLYRWDQAIEKRTLLRPETWALAFEPAVTTDDPKVRYGFGWRISDHRGRRVHWHSGETRGFRNALVRFPDDRLTIIILTNRNDPPPYRTALAIADLFLD